VFLIISVLLGRYSYGPYVFHYPILFFLLEQDSLHLDWVPQLFGSSLPRTMVFVLSGTALFDHRCVYVGKYNSNIGVMNGLTDEIVKEARKRG
jgi:peptidoglycan/LPS O-acetylase OafA/YrhL